MMEDNNNNDSNDNVKANSNKTAMDVSADDDDHDHDPRQRSFPRIAAGGRPNNIVLAPELLTLSSTRRIKSAKYKKASGAPKRFRPAFILFSSKKHREIRKEMGDKSASERTGNISKLVAQAWKSLSEKEKAEWKTLANNDKIRFNKERNEYHGPWKVPNVKEPKDVNAPKRPVSAYFIFANARRAQVKRQMLQSQSTTTTTTGANATNGEISKRLAAMWKATPREEQEQYFQLAKLEWEKHAAAMEAWKTKKNAENEKDNDDDDELLQLEHWAMDDSSCSFNVLLEEKEQQLLKEWETGVKETMEEFQKNNDELLLKLEDAEREIEALLTAEGPLRSSSETSTDNDGGDDDDDGNNQDALFENSVCSLLDENIDNNYYDKTETAMADARDELMPLHLVQNMNKSTDAKYNLTSIIDSAERVLAYPDEPLPQQQQHLQQQRCFLDDDNMTIASVEPHNNNMCLPNHPMTRQSSPTNNCEGNMINMNPATSCPNQGDSDTMIMMMNPDFANGGQQQQQQQQQHPSAMMCFHPSMITRIRPPFISAHSQHRTIVIDPSHNHHMMLNRPESTTCNSFSSSMSSNNIGLQQQGARRHLIMRNGCNVVMPITSVPFNHFLPMMIPIQHAQTIINKNSLNHHQPYFQPRFVGDPATKTTTTSGIHAKNVFAPPCHNNNMKLLLPRTPCVVMMARNDSLSSLVTDAFMAGNNISDDRRFLFADGSDGEPLSEIMASDGCPLPYHHNNHK